MIWRKRCAVALHSLTKLYDKYLECLARGVLNLKQWLLRRV